MVIMSSRHLVDLTLSDDYVETVKSYTSTVTLRGPWVSVGDSQRIQGWKLHLSSVPASATQVLNTILPYLIKNRIPFKCAKNRSTLEYLNEGSYGNTQVGKFITIYPISDEATRKIALDLIPITRGFPGPVIVTDMRLGDVLYSRYGCFNGIVSRDRLGQYTINIYDSDGRLIPDQYRVPFVPPANVANPVDDISNSYANQRPQASSRLFGPGYLIVEVVRVSAKGSTFKAIDLRRQQTVGVKILKQGRSHCMTDTEGRDMRARLKHQMDLHSRLSGRIPMPTADNYFEVDNNAYIAVEYIDGETIESFAFKCLGKGAWCNLDLEVRVKCLRVLRDLTIAVADLHSCGIIHRDLSASNVWISKDESVSLLDFELAYDTSSRLPPFGSGTPGFMSPSQSNHEEPVRTDDIFAIGCLIALVVTGVDPRRLLFCSEQQRGSFLGFFSGSGASSLVDLILSCIRLDSSMRPWPSLSSRHLQWR